MMKKVYSLAIIIFLILASTLFAEHYLTSSFAEFAEIIGRTQEALMEEDFETAGKCAEECLDAYEKKQRPLMFFISSEALSIYKASISAMHRFTKEETADEALAEAARAVSQLIAIEELFFRLI